MAQTSVESEEVLVAAPLGRDAPLICELLRAEGFSAREAPSIELVTEAITAVSCGAAIIAEEVLSAPRDDGFERALAKQRPWSDFPLVLLSGHGVAGDRRMLTNLQALGNVTVLDRPVHTRTLLSAVRAAVRARRRQYAARREIEQRDQFLAMLGHELRNPLGAIRFACENLKRSPDGGRRNAVEVIDRQTGHLARLVDDLLDVARVTSGRVTLSREPLDLGELLHRAVDAVVGTAESRRQRLTLEVHGGPTFVEGDPTRLEQVVNNLLTNAVKYTPEGGSIEVTLEERGGFAEVRVRDDGIGIEPAMLGSVFDLFTQAHAALDRAQGGMGIGLTLVKWLVTLHHGEVGVHSDGPGRGSEFLVRLPACAPAAARPQPEALSAPRPLVVAIVEDNIDLRESLKALLEDEGHTVLAAENGLKGAELIIERLPQLALIDIGLPDLNGYDVARKVRQAVRGAVRLVAVTGYGQPEDRQRAAEAGFDLHIKKPIELALLDNLIATTAT